MKVPVYNIEGKEVGTTLLPKEMFGVPMNPDLVHQVVVSQMAKRRQISAHTKNRGEVRGGGRKPWRQKGTGRARAGSIRSPIWRGGGKTFGPRKEKIYDREIPKKMRRKALFMVLSEKVKKKLLTVIDELKIDKPKTREIANILKNMPIKGSVLIVLPSYETKLILAARNIPKIKTIEARNLNALDLLSFKYLLMPKETIKTIKVTFLK